MNEMNKDTKNTEEIQIKEVYNLIVLDKSGSMASIAPQALGGLNETVNTIRVAGRESGLKQFVTISAFCGCSMQDLCHNELVENVKTFTPADYQPCCMTPLYDAMGFTLARLRKEVEGREDVAVIVTIITDGYENASKEWTGPAVKQLVEELKAMGWVIAYIGANQNLDEVKINLSISNTMAFQATPEATEKMFAKESKARQLVIQKCCYNRSALKDYDYFADENIDSLPY